jgi:putative transposase
MYQLKRANQVCSTDITYIRLNRGFLYLVTIIDWFSRYVLSWEVSTTLDTSFCLDALDRAFHQKTPEIFNNDQGVQFTCKDFVDRLKTANVRISWDGRGRALDNIFVERLWRTVKYEEVYMKDYETVPVAVQNLKAFFRHYNYERIHQSLEYQTPAQIYYR